MNRNEANLKAVKKYQQSEKGKAACKAWRESPKGKTSAVKAVQKYRKTVKGAAATKAVEARHYLKRGREYSLQKKYGLTLADYDQLFDEQDGLCKICGEPEITKNQYGVVRLSVDHDHKTGKLRNLLCASCNTVLGLVKENIETLMSAALYLERHKT